MKMSNKAKRKRALEAAEFITHSTMLVQKFREIFQLYDCSDKKVKKHIIKMLNLYSDVLLYRKSNGYKLEKMLDADSCYTDEDKSQNVNKNEDDDEEENTLEDFLNKL